jgi:hypothetical protein
MAFPRRRIAPRNPGSHMETASPRRHRPPWHLQRTLRTFLAVLGLVGISFFAIWTMEKWLAPEGKESGMSEATAALGASLLAVAGTNHGHHAGRERKLETAGDGRAPVRRWAEGLCFILLTMAVWAGAVWLARMAKVSPAAVAGLAGGVIGITGVDALHDIWWWPRDSLLLGRTLILLAVLGGLYWIWKDPNNAEEHAALLAALVTVGGTQLGHAQSFKSTAMKDAG